jgi:Bacterial regulatory proteins, gntR family
MSILFRTQKCLTIFELTRAWGSELAKGGGEAEQHVHDLTRILMQDIVNGHLDDSGPLWEGRRSGVGCITPDYKVGLIEGRHLLELAKSELTNNWALHYLVVMKEAVLDFASRHEIPPPSWWTDGTSVSTDADVTTKGAHSIPASPILAPTHSARPRGRRPKKLDQVKDAMREDIRRGHKSPHGLRDMLEKDLAASYGVSRDTVRRARDAVLLEMPTGAQGRRRGRTGPH